jgi:(p)ppGpp synthase/HD superfamily hydrolase
MSRDVVRIARAAHFAAQRHAGQSRKGSNQEPYVVHLAEVAALLAEATDGDDADLIAAGWLHDAIEDQGVTPPELAEAFGEGVADLVCEVTDDKNLEKAERKERQVEEAARKSVRARLLKLADKTSNVSAIVDDPPADWPRERLRDYVRWGLAVVDAGCRNLNPALEERFDAAVARAEDRFGPVRDRPWHKGDYVWD